MSCSGYGKVFRLVAMEVSFENVEYDFSTTRRIRSELHELRDRTLLAGL